MLGSLTSSNDLCDDMVMIRMHLMNEDLHDESVE